ncbi:hypothetical protein CEXT_764451 [Caerostris extrusa]|uniref:Secreted protein n=1 Tax=Caerostris extrusa TaxID=172846 RepID=A0AAV4R431_CAEEX|nr:hypothetical protein CEXT_764451 [Caerostris extrusa]
MPPPSGVAILVVRIPLGLTVGAFEGLADGGRSCGGCIQFWSRSPRLQPRTIWSWRSWSIRERPRTFLTLSEEVIESNSSTALTNFRKHVHKGRMGGDGIYIHKFKLR